jgi:CDP-glycerol glycerophosphotransferase (TagB/SpsB family)
MIIDNKRKWLIHYMQRLLVDNFFIFGSNSKRVCEIHNMDTEKIKITGCPRYDELFKKQNPLSEKYILFTGSGIPSTGYSYFLSTEFLQNYEKLLTDVFKNLQKFNEKIIVKRHPTQDEVINLVNIVKKNLPEAKIFKNINTYKILSEAKLVISPPSTIVTEAIILDKPVILLSYIPNDDGVPYSSSGSVILVDNTSNISEIIEKVLYDKKTQVALSKGRERFIEKMFVNKGVSAQKTLEAINANYEILSKK